eukprot:5005446-Alexandrium_andersonii.AAC.1
MQNRLRRSELELRGPENDLTFHPRRPRPEGSAPFFRAESDGDDETGWRARRRRFSGWSEGAVAPPGGPPSHK